MLSFFWSLINLEGKKFATLLTAMLLFSLYHILLNNWFYVARKGEVDDEGQGGEGGYNQVVGSVAAPSLSPYIYFFSLRIIW